MADELDPEDAKLVTLARASLPRATGPREGAAVRDEIGRTYAAASVVAGELSLGALEFAIAMAVSSGCTRLEAVAVATAQPLDVSEPVRSALAALGAPPILWADPSGRVVDRA